MLAWIMYLTALIANYLSDKFMLLVVDNHNALVPVFDLFYYVISEQILMFDKFYLPDVFIGLSFVFAYPYSLSTAFIKMHTIILLIRFLCVITTSGYVSVRYARFYDTRGLFNGLHADLIISGHAMYKTLCILFIIHNSGVIYSLLCVPVLIFGILTNLLVGDHYTSDIILGISLAILVYY